MKRAVRFALEHAAAALLLDPGLGKTSITLAAIKMLLKEKGTTGVIVFAPLRPATSTWPNEVAKWADFEGIDLVVLHGKNFSKLLREQHDVYVTNYESIPKLFSRRKVGKVWKYELTEDGKELMKRVDMLVWDELQKMKNSDTLRYKLVKPHIKKFYRRLGLTGSPASNGLLDLFGQCYVLDEGRTLGPFITHYRSQYFLPTTDFSWVLKAGAEEAIYDRVRPLALRMAAEDYLDLPRLLEIPIKLDLPEELRPQYVQMEEELLIELNGTTIAAANSAGAKSKCRQMCSGALYLPTIDPVTGEPLPGARGKATRKWADLHDLKLDALEDLTDELQGQQLLVAYDFNSDLERLLKRFPGTPFIGGGVTPKRAREIEVGWNAGEIPLLFGHPASMAHGLNFQGSNAHHVAHFTLTWDFELYDQFNKRVLRQGNTAECVRVYLFVMRNTVDESVAFALRRKHKTQKQFLDAIKSRQRLPD